MSQQIGWSIEAKLLAEIKKVISKSGISSVKFYATKLDFPVPGKPNIIYLDLDSKVLYYWDGTQYVELTSSTPYLSASGANNYTATVDNVDAYERRTIFFS
jgi:hypothetical protein